MLERGAGSEAVRQFSGSLLSFFLGGSVSRSWGSSFPVVAATVVLNVELGIPTARRRFGDNDPEVTALGLEDLGPVPRTGVGEDHMCNVEVETYHTLAPGILCII
jgi:hypothetical protein